MKKLILVIVTLYLSLFTVSVSANEGSMVNTRTHISQGVIQWFDNHNGFGYIMPDDNSGTVFVHFSNILSDSSTDLQQGQRVEYKVVVVTH